MKRANSSRFADPPSQFRVGHVSARNLDAKRISASSKGFSIQLPSGAPITTPAVHAGLVISSGGFHSKQIYAFDAKTGDPAWAVDLDDDGPSAPACEDDICVFNTESCTVFALSAKTGEMLWSWWLGDPLMSAPTIADGKVFTAYPAQGNTTLGQQQAVAPAQQETKKPGAESTGDRPPQMTHALAAFDLRTGELVWNKWIDADVMSAPVAAGDAVYITTFAGTVVQFDQDTGEIVAARRDRATSAPSIVGSDVFYTKRTDAKGARAAEEAIARSSASQRGGYVSSRKTARYLDHRVQSKSKMWSKGKKLDASNGFGGGAPSSANAKAALRTVGQSSVSTLQAFQGSRIVNVGQWNLNTMGDEIVCTDARSGKEQWRHALAGDLADAGGYLGTPPAAAGGSIFVATLSGAVLELDPDSGKRQRRIDVGAPIRSQPVVEDGWLYVGTDNGRLIAVRLGHAKYHGWSQWGGNAARSASGAAPNR